MWQWEKTIDDNGREMLEKNPKRGLPTDLCDQINVTMPSFLLHHYIKRYQAKIYNQLLEEVKSGSECAIMQMDFAENYTTMWQDEIQSAHWKKRQITLLTSVLWYGSETHSNVVVSDDLSHTKDSIITFLVSLIDKFIKLKHGIRILHLWTDGPSAQFKNRFIQELVAWLARYYVCH